MPQIHRALFAQDLQVISSLVSAPKAKGGEYIECSFEDLIVALPAMQPPSRQVKRKPTTQEDTTRADTTLLCLK